MDMRKAGNGRCGSALLLVVFLLGGTLTSEGEDLRPALLGVDLAQRGGEERINILVEVGKLSPPVVLLQLGRVADISLELQKGEAEFLSSVDGSLAPERTRSVHYRSHQVHLPPLFAGSSEFVESDLTVSIDGVVLGEPIRISSLQEGHIERLWQGMRTLRPAILWGEKTHVAVIIDPRKIATDELQNDVEELRTQRDWIHAPLSPQPGAMTELKNQTAHVYEEGGFRCPVLVWYRPRSNDSPFRSNRCFLNTKISGSIEFVGDSPTAGWSVKPELGGSGSLFRPTQFIVNQVDGLYRNTWGCGVALKIPNNVVARVFGLDASCCQGIVAAALGKTCTWVNPLTPPESPTWPVCPLP